MTLTPDTRTPRVTSRQVFTCSLSGRAATTPSVLPRADGGLSFIAASLLLATSAAAQDSRMSWGGAKPFTVDLVAASGPHIGAVVATNQPTLAGTGPGTFVLTLDGITVSITVIERVGRTPDTVSVECLTECVAVPREIILEEGATGEIRLFPLDGVGM